MKKYFHNLIISYYYMPYYAVHKGKVNNVFTSWDDCKNSIHGYSGAIYKKFNNKEDAEEFVKYGDKKIINENIKNFTPDIHVYTDGACSNNGSINAKAGLGIYFGEGDKRNTSKAIEGKQTNNVAELMAIIETYHILKNEIENGLKIMICSDSKYAINCCTSYGEKCEKGGWKTKIPNIELVKEAYLLFKDKTNIEFKHILAHTGKTDAHSIGNDHADRLANEAIGMKECMYQNLDKQKVKPSDRIYLNVAYKDKDFAKVCGARWDSFKKKWYISNNLDKDNREMIFKHFDRYED